MIGVFLTQNRRPVHFSVCSYLSCLISPLIYRSLRNKKAAVILTAGGKGNADKAYHHVRAMMRMLNATGYDEHWVVSPSTDTIPADQDEAALSGVRSIAAWLNE